MPERQSLSDRLSVERLVHPLFQTARGYLTDEEYFAVEATLSEAVERAKDLEAEASRLRAENERLIGELTTLHTSWVDLRTALLQIGRGEVAGCEVQRFARDAASAIEEENCELEPWERCGCGACQATMAVLYGSAALEEETR